MPKKATELTALEVGRLRRAGFNPVGGVPGLGLRIGCAKEDKGLSEPHASDKKPRLPIPSARSWILRFSFEGRRPEMGLGGFPEIGLANARIAARDARAQVRAGINPIDAAKGARSAEIAKRAASRTFADCAAEYIQMKSPEWANVKHAGQWTATLATYAAPVIGGLLVQDIDTPHIMKILQPIWEAKTETATRLRGRLEKVLDWATVGGYRQGPNPARWKAHLEVLLQTPGKIAKVEHHAALPYVQLAGFMAQLRAAEGQGARALELAILTVARSGEVRGATWGEMDLEAKAWNVPPERMKMRREHRVPLSNSALCLLRAMPRGETDELVFPSSKGTPLSDMTLTAITRRMGVNAVPHGFRATFKTWATELTSFPREVIEMALAHVNENKTEDANQRGELFDKRANLMQAWADFCGPTPVPRTRSASRTRADL